MEPWSFPLDRSDVEQGTDHPAEKNLLTRSSVRTLIAFPPAFWTKVLGITSIASATALNGQLSMPWMVLAVCWRRTEMAISVAPPPGARSGLKITFRATDIASARFRSISLITSLEGPRSKIVHAFGVLHLVKNVKYLREDCQSLSFRDRIGHTRHPVSRYGIDHNSCQYQTLLSLLFCWL